MSATSEPESEGGSGPMLFARVLDGQGGGRPISWRQARDWQPGRPGEVLWLHLRRTCEGVTEWLQEDLYLPEPTAELLTSDATRPRAFREGHALVATLRGINFNPGADPEDMVSMQVWSDGVRVLTLRRHRLQSPQEVRERIDAGSGPVDAGALITCLVEHLAAQMNQTIVDLNEQIDRLDESDPTADPDGMLDRISQIRRDCLALKRHMSPQHEALERIARDAPGWFEDHDRREIAETIDRMRRYLDDLDISKESAVLLQDDLRARAVARTGRTSYLLTIVAAIFLPLTFVTGLLGINVSGIPGANDTQAFWIVVGLCCAIFAAQLLLFRWWRWF